VSQHDRRPGAGRPRRSSDSGQLRYAQDPARATRVRPYPRFHVHFTPTSASWLNLVERWFATLTEKQIKRGAHRSTRALEAAIREYLTISNGSAKPFV